MKSIGIVLPDLPGYSETFLNTKIDGLLSNGYRVVLLVDSASRSFDKSCEVVREQKAPKGAILRLLKMAMILLQASLFFPGVLRKFLRYEKELGRGFKGQLENLFKSYHILSQKKLDHLHFGFATLAVRRENAAKSIGAKCSTSFRGYDIMIYPNAKKEVYKPLWKRLDAIHTLSQSLREEARQKYFLPQEVPYHIITPAIDVTAFNAQVETPSFNQGIHLVTVSRLHWVKGIDYIIQAVGAINQKGINCTLKIIGDGKLFDRLLFTAHQSGVQDKVAFVGKKTPEEIKSYLKEASMYVQYSNSEGFCNAVLEAQSMGKLCVVSDAGGLPENVIDGSTGWVVAKRNPTLLADKLIEVSQLPIATLSGIQNQAQQRVQGSYNLEKQRAEFQSFFNE